MTKTDTKRLRSLHTQYWHGTNGKMGLSLDEGIEFRALIIAACDELESKNTDKGETK